MARNGKPQTNGTGDREADRRRTILRAAIEVFAKKGYHGCRIADVAREAGVAYGLVYHYFHNKEDLLGSVFESAWGGFVARIREATESDASLEEKVRAISALSFQAYQHDPRGVRVLILEIARSPAGAKVNRGTAFGEVIELSQAMFGQAKRKGELRAEADPLLCAAMLFGSIEMGLTAFVLGMLDPTDPAAVERAQVQVAESFLHGVSSASMELSWKREKSSTRTRALRRS